MLKDQQLLAKQMEVTGNAVAQLSINQHSVHDEDPPSSTSSVSTKDQQFRQPRPRVHLIDVLLVVGVGVLLKGFSGNRKHSTQAVVSEVCRSEC
ncbi:hypothetical protein PAHAL_2G298000 [Panicum hallii]|jgi:hypothetical protein|uniref:Uncharacterized protein n=1 Tax=Panicum hallii TaxID=206008 RepID=A0A2S3H0F5_9POAL|nr:hypothetical protein PAHAL_2G298000 [Panicum hallii]